MAVSPPLSSCGPPLLLQWAPLGGARRVWRHQPRIAAPPPPPLPAAAPAPARRPSAPPAERQRLQPLHLLRPPLQGAGQELQHQDKDRHLHTLRTDVYPNANDARLPAWGH